MVALIVIVAVILLIGLAALLLYNQMVSRRQAVDNSWAQIEAALQRRHDLIPNLVESVKGYAKHERATFEEVTRARSTALAAKRPQDQAAAEDKLTEAVGRVNLLAEQYPELKASDNFQQLSSNLSDTEDQIQITRRVYNDTVQTYNTGIQIFPGVLVANAFNFEPREFFDAPTEAEATPEVSFTAGAEAPKA